jgi:hypothetical protein
MNVEVRIGRLVLDGVQLHRRERAALPDAVRSELLNLLADSSGAPAGPIGRPGSDRNARTPRVDAIARQIAASVHGALPAPGPGSAASGRRVGPAPPGPGSHR